MQPRYHAFDCLRAAMMMLGIWMHGVQCYTTLKVYLWPFKDTARSLFFDFTINWVHMFRMPVFFAMAGFFFAMLTMRRGATGALSNRARRILVPFVLAWLVLAPVILFTMGYATSGSFAAARALARSGAAYLRFGPLHLWFLEYLVLFYPMMLAADFTVRRVAGKTGMARLSSIYRWCLRSPFRAVWMAVLTILPMSRMGGWLSTQSGFVPAPHIVAVYFVFFAFGYALYYERDLLADAVRTGWLEIAAGFLVAAVGFAVLTETAPPRLWIYLGPLCTWLFVFGSISLFLRYLNRPATWIRYLSDASYWMYLLHVPVLIWVQLLLAPLPIPALAKGLLTLSITMPLLLVSYHWAVRPTWIGALLNGRRFPGDRSSEGDSSLHLGRAVGRSASSSTSNG